MLLNHHSFQLSMAIIQPSQSPRISSKNDNFAEKILEESPKLRCGGGLLMESEKAEKKLKETQ